MADDEEMCPRGIMNTMRRKERAIIVLQTALMRLSLAALLGTCMGATRPFQVRIVWIGVFALVALGSFPPDDDRAF